MNNNFEICRAIAEVVPDVRGCGVDIDVSRDDVLNAWRVVYGEEDRSAVTFLYDKDIATCLDLKECNYMGLVADLKRVASG